MATATGSSRSSTARASRYEVVDIEQDPAAAEFVMSVNGGNQTVPRSSHRPANGGDEIVMTNPLIVQVKAALVEAAVSS